MNHLYNREVDITYISSFDHFVVKIFPLFEHNIKKTRVNSLSVYHYKIDDNKICIHRVEEQNSEIKSFSFNKGDYTEFYEKISKNEYYLIKYSKSKMENIYIVKDYVASEIFMEDIHDSYFIKRDLGDLKKDFETKKSKAYQSLNKAKLCTYYNSLITGKSSVYTIREITKSYEDNVVNFMYCMNKKKYNFPNELIYIIMKFIKFV